MSRLVFKENQNTALMRKNISLKKQFLILESIKRTKVVLRKQKTSTYMFTLLSFVNYLKSEGFSLKLKLNKLKPASPAMHTTPLTNQKAVKSFRQIGFAGFKPYETKTKFAGVKKISITLNFKGYYGLVPILTVMEKLYILFPVKYTNFVMNKKSAVINLNLYSFKGV